MSPQNVKVEITANFGVHGHLRATQ